VVEAIRAATRACLAGELDAIVTGPISKEMLGLAGYTFPGHTELLAELCGNAPAVMLLAGGRLRVVPATIHCALREVPERIARLDWQQLFRVLSDDLARSFGLARPRIALCGLNPHASDGGRFGDEEARVLEPAVAAARAAGLDVRGPLAADTIFSRTVAGEFDCVVGTYHDQVLGPLKLHAFGRAVNVTLGLPIVRTSVDHGTAFDIAGRGRADSGSLEEAIALALEIAARRQAA
jgi:4-hydroxythreonine-4-phosphate dehydrogenase